MCGIAGWVGEPIQAPEVVERMIDRLYHRGPDAQATKVFTDATLIHTRLSIIDLSPAGAQPMSNEDGSIWVVFNGEIYNHAEVRERLLQKGHTFRGRSDTEIIPHLYEEYGSHFVDYLKGMFTIAIWDSRKKRMTLARDRFGIKPLFFSFTNRRLAFASEIGALREVPNIDCSPNRQAIRDFAALFFIPAPQTFYKGISALAPGEILEASWEDHRIVCNVRPYHKWTIQPDMNLSLSEAVERAEHLLDEAVRSQLESDVPLGTFLSGGIDSSLITRAAQQFRPVQSFNVRFADSKYDETSAALEVARHVGSDHTTLSMDNSSGTWDYVTSILTQAGQPFADTSIFAVSEICQLMRKHLTVALSGDGGDEGFGGYRTFNQIDQIARLQQVPSVISPVLTSSFHWLTKLNLAPQRYSQRFLDLSEADDIGIMENLHTWIRPAELESLCQDQDLLPVRRWFQTEWDHQLPENSSRIETLSALETEIRMRLFLPNDYLFKVDTASMRSSLEVRVPLLDEDLIDFGLTLSHRLKVYRNRGKRVLRGVARKQLPKAVVTKRKQGFEVPVDHWVDGSFRDCTREYLLSPNSRLSEYFRPEAYKPIVEAFCNNESIPEISRAGLFGRVTMLLSVELSLASV
jgi:asparagine synthase (glutamine-hydrolysing)